MNNYEVTYHFINGEVKKVKYREVPNDKLKFIQMLSNGAFVGNKEMEIFVNIERVNFMEVKELHETEIENKNEIKGEELYNSIMKNQEIQESREKGEMKK